MPPPMARTATTMSNGTKIKRRMVFLLLRVKNQWLSDEHRLGWCSLFNIFSGCLRNARPWSLFDEQCDHKRHYSYGDRQEEGIPYGQHICLPLHKSSDQQDSCTCSRLHVHSSQHKQRLKTWQ